MRPRILFIGGTPRGLRLMEMLVERGEDIIYACIMKEDEHEFFRASEELSKVCVKNRIEAEVCRHITGDKVAPLLRRRPDVAFVCGWRRLLPESLWKGVPIGCIAAHDSLLPRYRGFAPLNWAIINGEDKTGVTLFKISGGTVDSGDIFGQKAVEIGRDEAAADVYERIIAATLELYSEFLAALKAGEVRWRRQDETKATYGRKRTPDDGEIDWRGSAARIHNLIRALSFPYPGAWTYYDGRRVCIEKAALPERRLAHAGKIPGEIVSINDSGVSVLCGEGQLVIKEARGPSGGRVKAADIFSSEDKRLGV